MRKNNIHVNAKVSKSRPNWTLEFKNKLGPSL